MSNYWGERVAKAQTQLTTKSIKETEKQLQRYYGTAMKRIIEQFEQTYNKLLANQELNKEITPADLYKLDKYWQAQNQMRAELRKLGDRQVSLMSKKFELLFFDIYFSFGIPGAQTFSTIDAAAATQIVNQIWCADGKSWSARVWENIDKLQDALGSSLINSVVTGAKTTQLKKQLQEQFGVSYTRADVIARTELAHIQTQAARQRYQDYGIQEVEVWVDEDERTCPICAKHEGERHSVNSQMPVPFHPRCRCCMVPVVE